MDSTRTLAARLAPVLRRFGVRFAYLWGSRARSRARPDSDYDIAVDMPMGRGGLDRFLDLADALAVELGGAEVDLTLLADANEEVRYLVQRTGKVLLDADSTARRQFEHRARIVYWDEQVRLRHYTEAMRRRLREGTFAS